MAGFLNVSSQFNKLVWAVGNGNFDFMMYDEAFYAFFRLKYGSLNILREKDAVLVIVREIKIRHAS